jgi:hypothetical protein
MEKLKEFLGSAFGFIRQTRDTYEAGTRFMRMRVWIVALLLIDVFATVAFLIFSGIRTFDVDVWFEPGFPSNMLVVRNQESPVSNAILVLDERYRLSVERIDVGVNGYEVNRAFRDSSDASPPDSYKPQKLVIKFGGGTYDFSVGDKSDGS